MDEPFYAEGLRFECRRCSGCCRGEPGYVFLTKADVRRLLGRLGLDFKHFFREYCTLVDAGNGMALSLREIARSRHSRDCALWGEEGCAVYEDRPAQCATYPFWPAIVESREAWKRESAACPGIDSGELRSRTHIEERLFERRMGGTVVLGYTADPECLDEDTILGGEGIGPDSAHAVESQE